MKAKKKVERTKRRIIRYKKQSSLKWYLIGTIIAAFALATGWFVSTKTIDKTEAYLARRRR